MNRYFIGEGRRVPIGRKAAEPEAGDSEVEPGLVDRAQQGLQAGQGEFHQEHPRDQISK